MSPPGGPRLLVCRAPARPRPRRLAPARLWPVPVFHPALPEGPVGPRALWPPN